MDLGELIVFDVGHGNAALYKKDSMGVVIDGGPDYTLAEFVESARLTRIGMIFISHADEDHLRGVLYLLENNPELPVDALYVNPAQEKDTLLWSSFSLEVERLEQRGTTVITALTRSSPGAVDLDQVTFQVVSPPPAKVLKENRDNRWSAAIRVLARGEPVALLCGDIDRVALDELLRRGEDIRADILVFPHHGGHPEGADPAKFATDLATAVSPRLAVFSLGRGRYDNPLPEVVAAVIKATGPHVACTQLSRRCSLQTYADRAVTSPSAGARTGSSCCGTLRFCLPLVQEPTAVTQIKQHRQFVDVLEHEARTRDDDPPVCRR